MRKFKIAIVVVLYNLFFCASAQEIDTLSNAEYLNLLNSTDIQLLKQYLTTHPDVSYYDDISNHLADLLSKNYKLETTPDELLMVLSYAKNDSIKAIVQARIDNIFEAKRKYARQRNRKDRINIGANIAIDYGDKNLGFEIGPIVKFGRYNDWVNFAVSINYTYNSYIDSQYDAKAHYISLPMIIKANLVPIGNKAKAYIGGGLEWLFRVAEHSNVIIDGNKRDIYENNSFLTNLCIGVQARKWDVGLYYKRSFDGNGIYSQYINSPLKLKYKYGIRFIYYFKN